MLWKSGYIFFVQSMESELRFVYFFLQMIREGVYNGGMKKKVLLLLVLVIGFVGFVGIKAITQTSSAAGGEIHIIATPEASVFINNAAMGKTPYKAKMKADEYIVKLIPDGEASQTASWQGKVKVNGNTLTYVNRELGTSDITSAGEIFSVTPAQSGANKSGTGEISIESEPNGVIVYLDNDEKGVSSLVLHDVPKGDHEISVYMPNFLRRTQKVNVVAGYRVNAAFGLAIDQVQQKTITPSNSEATSSAAIKKSMIVVKDTPTGWLRVRTAPTLGASESARINIGESYVLLDEQDGWYKIQMKDSMGWVSSVYTDKKAQ